MSYSVNLFRQRRRLRILVIRKLGGCCSRCGFSDYRALHLDHKVGGQIGRNRERLSIGEYISILEGKTQKYQLLCANCNVIKVVESDEAYNSKEDLNVYFLEAMKEDGIVPQQTFSNRSEQNVDVAPGAGGPVIQ